MIDSIMAIPLLIGTLFLILFTYRKLRVDLFRDKVFQIRRALFLIAADNPDLFFKDNSFYRFFENILNTTLSHAENFSLFYSFTERKVQRNYAKKNKVEPFDFSLVKKNYLKKVKSPEIRKEVSKLMDSFIFHYALFLSTRTFFNLVIFFAVVIFTTIITAVRTRIEKGNISIERYSLFYTSVSYYHPNKMMNNSQFAFAASSMAYA
jgi:hypothetical protein